MKIKVLFFGLTHDLTGLAQEHVEVADGEKLDDLRRQYERRFPRIKELGRAVKAKFSIDRVGMVHRLGRLEIGETSVAIIVTAGHRRAAFDACHYAIDRLKQTVPIWKKEYFEDGAVWAEGEGQTRVLVEG